MKYLNLIFVVVLVTISFARDLKITDFKQPKPDASDITEINQIYSLCLNDLNNPSNPVIIMNIVKQKILVPEANFESLLKPLKNIAEKGNDSHLKKYAIIAYVVLSIDYQLNIDRDQLYNKDVDQFFTFINCQLPKDLVVSVN